MYVPVALCVYVLGHCLAYTYGIASEKWAISLRFVLGSLRKSSKNPNFSQKKFNFFEKSEIFLNFS